MFELFGHPMLLNKSKCLLFTVSTVRGVFSDTDTFTCLVEVKG